MSFGEKLKKARLAANMSQTELSGKIGVSERSIYSYEQLGVIPRYNNIKKCADALGVSAAFLLSDGIDDNPENKKTDEIFLANIENEYGSAGYLKAKDILDRTKALFSGGELSEEAKDAFFRTITELYIENSKEKQRPSKKLKSK